MVKHIWSVLCRKSIVDSETNNLSINDVLEQLGIDVKIKKGNEDKVNVVNVPIEFEVVSMWVKDNKSSFKGTVHVEIIDPLGKVVKTFEQPLEMQEAMKRMRARLRVMGMAIEQSGDYTFRVTIKEENDKSYKTVAELPLEVNLKKEIDNSIEVPKN